MDLTLDIPSLRALQYAHMLSIPFDNLDIHLERKIVLDEARLFNKIVERHRGGHLLRAEHMPVHSPSRVLQVPACISR